MGCYKRLRPLEASSIYWAAEADLLVPERPQTMKFHCMLVTSDLSFSLSEGGKTPASQQSGMSFMPLNYTLKWLKL